MKKLESTFKNMVLVLGGISVFAAGALGIVNELTMDPIKLAEVAAQETAIKEVTPEFDNSPVDERYMLVTLEGDSINCFPAKNGGKLVGVAIESYTAKGFGGEIKVMVGLEPDGRIFNYSVLKHKETPGLGSKMEEWFRTENSKHNILGLDPGKDKVWVSKDDGDVDAITAATISSRAFLDAIDRAYRAYMKSKDMDLDARTGASKQITKIEPTEHTEPAETMKPAKTVKPKAISEETDGVSAASAEYSTNEGEEQSNEK
jgi:electron transport complex protein RnfG